MSTDKFWPEAIALAFPLGGISELTRKVSAAYIVSAGLFRDDPTIREKDLKPLVGHYRRALINNAIIEFAQQYPQQVSYNEKMEGEEGCNNHVELKIGRFLLTHHHQTSSKMMPRDFINFSSRYNQANASLNDTYFDPPWFTDPKLADEVSDSLINLLLLHETSSEGLHQVGNIEFVLPKNNKKFVTLPTGILVQRQNEIMDLSEEDLLDFRLRIEREFSRIVA